MAQRCQLTLQKGACGFFKQPSNPLHVKMWARWCHMQHIV